MNRSEIAKKAVNERWHPTIPKANYSGILNLGGQEIACDVLDDGRRVLRLKTFLKAIGRGKIGGKDRKGDETSNLPFFMQSKNLSPYLSADIGERGQVIKYKGPNNKKLSGYDASLLPEVCKMYVKAEDESSLEHNQKPIAKVCRSILYGLATVGIISLVDEVTGYVNHRNRTELESILEQYISEELRKWTKKFPDEFFKQVYRLHGWEYPKIHKNHPQYVGKLINEYIYDRLPNGVRQELENKNPTDQKGLRTNRHHQFLTEDVGQDHLQKQISQVITAMRLSDGIESFKKNMDILK